MNTNVNIETGNSPVPQLYYLADDVGQIENVASLYPDVAEADGGSIARDQIRISRMKG